MNHDEDNQNNKNKEENQPSKGQPGGLEELIDSQDSKLVEQREARYSNPMVPKKESPNQDQSNESESEGLEETNNEQDPSDQDASDNRMQPDAGVTKVKTSKDYSYLSSNKALDSEADPHVQKITKIDDDKDAQIQDFHPDESKVGEDIVKTADEDQTMRDEKEQKENEEREYNILSEELKDIEEPEEPPKQAREITFGVQDTDEDSAAKAPSGLWGQLPARFFIPVFLVISGVLFSVAIFGFLSDGDSEDTSVAEENSQQEIVNSDDVLPLEDDFNLEAYLARADRLGETQPDGALLDQARGQAIVDPTPYRIPIVVGDSAWEFLSISDLGDTLPSLGADSSDCVSKNGKWIAVRFNVTNNRVDPMLVRPTRIVTSDSQIFEGADLIALSEQCNFINLEEVFNQIVGGSDTRRIGLLFDVPADLNNFLVELSDFGYPTDFSVHYLDFDIQI